MIETMKAPRTQKKMLTVMRNKAFLILTSFSFSTKFEDRLKVGDSRREY